MIKLKKGVHFFSGNDPIETHKNRWSAGVAIGWSSRLTIPSGHKTERPVSTYTHFKQTAS